MSKSIVVIPTYNEVESIGSLLDELAALDVDVLVIDDGSPDGTAQVIKELQKKFPKILYSLDLSKFY